jgi:hypothetical protein
MIRERILFGFVNCYFRILSNVLYSYQQSLYLPSYTRSELFSIYSDPFRSAWFSALLFSLLFLATLTNAYSTPSTPGPGARPWEANMTPLHPTLGVLGFHLCPNGSFNSGGIMDGVNFGMSAGVLTTHLSTTFILGFDHARKTRPFSFLCCCFLLITCIFYLTLISGTTVTACGVNPNSWAPNSIVFQPLRYIYYICMIPPIFVTLCKTGMMSDYRRVAAASGVGMLILSSLFVALSSALQTLTLFWVLFYIAIIILFPTSILVVSILKKVRIAFNFAHSEYFVTSVAFLWFFYLLVWMLGIIHSISQSSFSTGMAVLDFFLLLGIIRASLDLDLNREEAIALFNNMNFPPSVDSDDLIALTYDASLKLVISVYNSSKKAISSFIGSLYSISLSIKSKLQPKVSIVPLIESTTGSDNFIATTIVHPVVIVNDAVPEIAVMINEGLEEKEEREQLEAREALAALTNTLFSLREQDTHIV